MGLLDKAKDEFNEEADKMKKMEDDMAEKKRREEQESKMDQPQ